MKGKRWTEEEMKLLREKYPVLAIMELVPLFPNKSKEAIHSKAVSLKIGKEKKRKVFTHQEIEELKVLFPFTPDAELANKFQCSVRTIHKIAHKRLKLYKTQEHVDKMRVNTIQNLIKYGQKNRFQKGHIPHNTGKPAPPEIYEKLKPTFFTKGHIPPNYKSIGTEVLTEDGYIKLKIEDPNVWIFKHRYIYEQHFGPIPKGYNVQFKNGNHQDCRIENLYMISRREQIKNNTINHYPAEIKKLIYTLLKLNKTINKASK